MQERNQIARLLSSLVLLLGIGLPANAENPCEGYKSIGDVEILLDDTGIASWEHLNPRRSFALAEPHPNDVESSEPESCKELWNIKAREATVRFTNATSSRGIVVKIPFELTEPQATSPLDKIDAQISKVFTDSQKLKNIDTAEGLKNAYLAYVGSTSDPAGHWDNIEKILDVYERERELWSLAESQDGEISNIKCDGKEQEKRTCVQYLQLAPGVSLELDRLIIKNAKKTISYSVSFFDSADTPTNAEGFLVVSRDGLEKEKPSKPSGSLVAEIGAKVDPDTSPPGTQQDGSPQQKFSSEHPYSGRDLQRFTGSGRLELSQNLGNRANASLTLGFKSSDLGASEKNDFRATVTQYKVDIFGLTGLSLRFGKFDFAKPSSSISTDESGEGFQVAFKRHSTGLLIKRESIDGIANFKDDDSQLVVYQGKDFPVRGSIFRNFDLLALYGEEKKPDLTYNYQTFGGEIRFGNKWRSLQTNSFSGNFSAYVSERDVRLDRQMNATDASGKVALLNLFWSFLKKDEPLQPKLLRSFTFSTGYGSGDDPLTSKDEGYTGETSSFQPITVISGFIPKIDTAQEQIIGRGLSNKTYLAVQYSERDLANISPLYQISKLLGTKRDVVSNETSVFLRMVRFNEEILGSNDAGWEFEIRWQIQSPAGVKSTLSYARFFPGSALESIFPQHDPQRISLTSSVTFK